MNAKAAVAGIVAVLLLGSGGVLLFEPVSQQASGTSMEAAGNEWSISGFSLVGMEYVTFAWTATGNWSVGLLTCSNQYDGITCSNQANYTSSGTSGSYSFSVAMTGSITFLAFAEKGTPINSTFSYTLTGTLSTIASLLVIAGGIVLIVAIVLAARGRRKAAPVPAGAGPPPPS